MDFYFEHPYQYEIENLIFHTDVFENGWKPEKYKPITANQYKLVDNLSALQVRKA
jgi:hypothetical protein